MTSTLLKQAYTKNLEQQFIAYATAECKLRIVKASETGAMNYFCNLDTIKYTPVYTSIVLTPAISNAITAGLKAQYPSCIFSQEHNGISIDWS
jgi:hypothetical protein